MAEGTLILVSGALLALGIAASMMAGRLRVPGLLLVLGLGMLVGSDVLGLIHFGGDVDDVELARTIGIVALALILFEGGLAAGFNEIRPVLGVSISLATVGTLATAVIVGLAASWLLDMSTLEGLLLGSIVAATDSAAIFSVLRHSSIDRRLARTLEGESGFNDAVAIVLVLGFIEWIERDDYGVAEMLVLCLGELSIGAAVGLAVGALAVIAFRRAAFATAGLYPVASIAAAALAFGAADVAHGSGFMAVYVAALVLGSASIPARRTVDEFHDGLAWVSQIALFLTLGLLVNPSEFGGIVGEALLISAVLILVARPAAAVLATAGSFNLRESAIVGWVGLRGAIPIVLATFPVIEGIDAGDTFFNIVFFVVLTSTLIQGITFEPLARALGVTTDQPALSRPLHEVGTIRRLGAEVLEFPVGEQDEIVGRVVNQLGLPREALVSVLERSGEALLPRGSTEIEGGDRLHILVREPVRNEVEGLFERWQTGPPIEDEPRTRVTPTGRAPIFTVKPWREEMGDPGAPERLEGTEVAAILRTRRGEPGALALLEDGRFAVTGDGVMAAGGTRQLFRYCRERIRRAESREARAWWEEVAGAVSQTAAR